MRSRSSHLLLALIFLLPAFATADYACIESRPTGYKVKLDKHLPKKWLLIGNRAIYDTRLHSELRSAYKDQYRGDANVAGSVCLYIEGIYVSISKSEFGSSAEYSRIAPKCSKCSPVKSTIKRLISQTGLRIGQSRAEASALLGIPLERDVLEISFDEIEKGPNGDMQHTEFLTLEFEADKLTRFSVYDFREGA